MKKNFKSHVHCTEYTAYNVSTIRTKLNSNASTITYSTCIKNLMYLSLLYFHIKTNVKSETFYNHLHT